MTYLSELKQLLTGRLLTVALLTSAIYIVLSVYAINRSILADTVFGAYSIQYKTTLLKSILIGSWSMLPPAEAILLVTIAILIGINIALMVRIFSSIQANKGLRVSFGGSSVLAIVSAGCPACGISILSLIGISAPLLPIQGIPLQLLAIILLIGSIWYSLRKLQQPMRCEMPIENKEPAGQVVARGK